jgi:uncharacterized protein YecE (DUF72 family)
MDFGKLSNIKNVNFSLPPDAPETARILRGLPPREGLMKVYIGCTGWSMKEWVGWVYPKGAKAQDYLHHYSRQFNTIELNTTHYRTPSVLDIEKWYQSTPADFRFAPKMLQTVSHSNNLGFGTGLTTQFTEAIQGLEEKLGMCFMQMPPHFKYNTIGILETYLKKFPKFVPLAIELRHEDWFTNPHHHDAVFKLFENYGISTVITDVAGRRDVVHQRLTTGVAVIRFVGNDLHPTDYSRIDEWVTRLKKWSEAGLHEVYFFTHEPDNLKAPELALYLFEKIQERFRAIMRGPHFIEGNNSSQISLF